MADAAGQAAQESRARQDLAAAAQRQAPRAMARPAPASSAPVAGWEPWTQVRVEGSGASVVLPRAQSGRLPELVARMLQSETAPAEVAGEPLLRLELAQGEQPLGVLELSGGYWRWLPLREVQQARGLRPDAALSQALREEAQRVLKR